MVINSETITYHEVIEFLARKKKIDLQKKTDQIVLVNVDQNNALVTGGIIYAGSRLIVHRKPEQPVKADTIELTYNPKQTMDRNKNTSARQRALDKLSSGGGVSSVNASGALLTNGTNINNNNAENKDGVAD